jgi:hypothetical protein
MKLYLVALPQKPAYIATHGLYTPNDAFIEAEKLVIEEAETWVSLYRNGCRDSDYIAFNKETGNIVIAKCQGYADEGGLIFENLFDGYLPDEAAFKSVLAWVRWHE